MLFFCFGGFGLLAAGQVLLAAAAGLGGGAHQEEHDQIERDVPRRHRGGFDQQFVFASGSHVFLELFNSKHSANRKRRDDLNRAAQVSR